MRTDGVHYRESTGKGPENPLVANQLRMASEPARAGLLWAIINNNCRVVVDAKYTYLLSRFMSSILVHNTWYVILYVVLLCCLSLWLHVCFAFVFFRSRLFALIEAVALLRSIFLRSSICMRLGSHTQLPNTGCALLLYIFLGRCSFFSSTL